MSEELDQIDLVALDTSESLASLIRQQRQSMQRWKWGTIAAGAVATTILGMACTQLLLTFLIVAELRESREEMTAAAEQGQQEVKEAQAAEEGAKDNLLAARDAKNEVQSITWAIDTKAKLTLRPYWEEAAFKRYLVFRQQQLIAEADPIRPRSFFSRLPSVQDQHAKDKARCPFTLGPRAYRGEDTTYPD